MKLYSNIKEALGNPKNYSVSKMLRETAGVEITVQGLDGYDRTEAKSIRFDVLCGLALLLKKRGMKDPWNKIGKWAEEEFLK